MRFGRQYSVTKQRITPEIRVGAWSLRAPTSSAEEIVDDESLNVLPDISAGELLEVLKNTEDHERLRRAIWTSPKIGGADHYRAIEKRLRGELSKLAEQGTENEPPVWSSAAVEVLAEHGGSEQRRFLLRLAEGSQPLSRLAALSLTREGYEGARAALKRMVGSSAADVVEQQRAASFLHTVFGDWSGLEELKAELWSREEGGFFRGLGAFIMVPAEQRDPAVVRMVAEALRKQQDPHHLVSLMFLVDGVSGPEEEIVPVLASHLSDRRRAREVLGDDRAGRVRDFAVYYLARYLSQTDEGRGLGTPPFPRSFLGRRRLRKQVMRALAPDLESR